MERMFSASQQNIACEHVPFEWIGDHVLVQRFNALLLISMMQFVYAILAYGTTFVWGWTNSYLDVHDWKTYVQAFGGISIVTIIAAVIVRFRVDGEKTLLKVKIYTGLMVVELLLWGARMGYIIHEYHENYFEFPYRDFFVNIASNLFVLVFLLVGMSVGAKVIHRTTKPQYSLLSDNTEETPHFRLVQLFYPLRLISLVQLTYSAAAFFVVLVSMEQTYDRGTSLLITPAAGGFTIISALLIIFFARLGKRALTYYAIMQMIDMVTGLMRGVAGLLYILFWINKGTPRDSLGEHQLIVAISIGTAFPLFYWVLGVITAYRTRVQIDTESTTIQDSDRVYGI
eukprot:Phypoly_transcript_10751.p1 GENE.Phypoly_transcript_10751~~Phypoly_transcript_10751.p1  ORF type:complete len:342 (+),score=38.50 Phypoly_transcript_10751:38-1063(+)